MAAGSLEREKLLDIYRTVSWYPNIKLRFSSDYVRMAAQGKL